MKSSSSSSIMRLAGFTVGVVGVWAGGCVGLRFWGVCGAAAGMRVSVGFSVPVGRFFETVGSDCGVFTVGNTGVTPVPPCVGVVDCCEGVCGCCVPAGRVCLGVAGYCVVAGFGSPVGAPEGLEVFVWLGVSG